MKRMPFSTWSVKGILAGRKAQTRRMMKPQPPDGARVWNNTEPHIGPRAWLWTMGGFNPQYEVKPRYKVGEIVAMGEALVPHDYRVATVPQVWASYEADGNIVSECGRKAALWTWKRDKLPSMFMPLWAARRWHIITDVRAERALDISEEDALAEGLVWRLRRKGSEWCYFWQASDGKWYEGHTAAWAATLRDHNPKMKPGDNPWVFAYTFEGASPDTP